ncbi:histidine kinase dimerization/phosphoacceptor domain -containing protein [Parvibaculum sp.]|uniref:histidine kinase dimerization/phosphoacceptor domain -containing protein n=1 Tax=Parvibaculum sp. TaxID=2024848 RepID=UPI00391C3BAE
MTLRSRVAMRLALILLPLCIAAEVAQYSHMLHTRALREQVAIASGESVLVRQRNALQEINTFLDTISAALPADIGDADACADVFRRVLPQSRNVTSLRLFTLSGETVCSVPTRAAGSLEMAAPSWFEKALSAPQFIIRAPDISRPPDEEAEQVPMMMATIPVFDREQRVAGLIAAHVPTRFLSLLLEEAELPGSAAAVAIADPSARILAQRSHGTAIDGWIPSSLSQPGELTTGAFAHAGEDGIRRIYVVSPLPGNLFGIYAQEPEDLSAGGRTILYFLLIFPLLIWIAASLLAGWAADHMVIEPLNKVRQAVRRYIAGDDKARIERDDGAPAEVQALATKFNTLADAIHLRNEDLRAAVAHQKALVREINHRVRNNLQVMNSLLSLQSRRAETPEQAAIFQDVQRRLNALGIVHSAFYQGNDLRSVDLADLLRDLCHSTEQQLSTEWGRPVVTMHCPKPVHALPDAALTLAFLVTELIAEAAPQFSPDGQPASRFDFELALAPGGGSVLTMRVDQPVLGELMESRPGEVHIKLFRGLIRQLRARMEVDGDNCVVTVTLPPLA